MLAQRAEQENKGVLIGKKPIFFLILVASSKKRNEEPTKNRGTLEEKKIKGKGITFMC